jgi:hypothetical protein
VAAAATQGRGELGSGQLAAPLGGWRQLEHRQGISGGQVGAEGLQRGRVEGPQGRPEAVELALAAPDGRLMGPGQHPDGLDQVAITADQAMVVAVGADQVGQHLGVTGVRLGPRGAVAFPVAAGGQGVDRHHLVAGRHQGPDQQPPVQLDADHHLGRLAGVVSDQRVQLGDASDPIRYPPAAQHGAGLVEHADLVVGFGPVHADKQQPCLLSPTPPPLASPRSSQRPNGSVLCWHPIPPAVRLLTSQQGRALAVELHGSGQASAALLAARDQSDLQPDRSAAIRMG